MEQLEFLGEEEQFSRTGGRCDLPVVEPGASHCLQPRADHADCAVDERSRIRMAVHLNIHDPHRLVVRRLGQTFEELDEAGDGIEFGDQEIHREADPEITRHLVESAS